MVVKHTPHTVYKLKDGTIVPSVTGIIGALGWDKEILLGWTRKMLRAGKDPLAYRDSAGAFGDLVHKYVETGDVGVTTDTIELLSDAQRADALRAYTRYQEWAAQHHLTIQDQELRLVSETYRFGGTIDAVAELDGAPTLLDVKTSSHISEAHRIQVAAYKHLYHDVHGIWLQPILLHLDRKGTEALEPYPMGPLEAEWEAFTLLLRLNELKKTLSPFDFSDM